MSKYAENSISSRSGRVGNFFEQYAIFLVLPILIAVFAVMSPNFLSIATWLAIAGQMPALTVVSIGITLVLLAGNIDLSVGSIVGMSAALIGAATITFGLPLWLGALVGIGAGGVVGLASGYISSYFFVPSFIVTLGMLEICRGLAYMTTHSRTVYIGSDIQFIVLPLFGSTLTIAFIISVVIVVGAHYIHLNTVFGRYITAIGTNPEAARMSGIRVRPYRAIVLAISGLLAGLGGLFNAAYLGASDPNAGIGMELSAIAAAVIGGTSLMGGRGNVLGTFAGVLIIVVMQNGLAQIGASDPMKRVITGGVIIVAVFIDVWRNRTR